jgi:hypothetical protein
MAQLIQPLEVIQGGVDRPSPADIRLDKTLVSPNIQPAEYRWVRETLGASFYDVLVTEKGTSSAFATSAYQTLWTTHLKSLCANAVLYESVPYVVMQLGTNGLYLIDNEYGKNAGMDGVKFYQDTLRQRITLQQTMIKDYLCASAGSFPYFSASAIGCPNGDCGDENDDFYNDFGLVL